ncbi:YetF domain-containing protein [Tepidibacillus fermentans]|uniref:Uncharacterized membrane protein YcaP (DUF421 family) n=1 Tax=Tepidibacillus fermentans TaxID=1281767 RepID=A0A4R3KK78_9BACI|nr:DUF421 domain-containing protein [Tepidibacillus fermentans]TCS83837.1 uncharacterized membrane protein YcaP (DUF421 family) [Tepidibacillus fermentans]
MEVLTALLRTLFMYFFVLIVLRFMGKREIGKLSIFDLVVSIMMAEIAVMVIEDTEQPLSKGVVPILILMVTQILLSYLTLKSKRLRDLVDGKPSILIANGKILDKEMARQRYSIDDLFTQLREKNIQNIADVEFAILEPSGKLSVFPKPFHQPVTKGDLQLKGKEYKSLPVPLVADGQILLENLRKIDKDELWLKKQLRNKGYLDIGEIYFVSIDDSGNFFIDKKDSN